MDKLVSVIIPCYNSELFLEETLTSVSEQDYGFIETILVDDGSTDRSVEIAQQFAGKIGLKIIRQQNSGVSAARNKGFLHSTGSYVVFLDSDDLLMPSFISSKVKLIEEQDFNGAGSKIFNFTKKGDSSEEPSTVSVHKAINSDLLNYNPLFSSVPSSFLFKSSLFAKAEDTPFNLKLMSTADRYLLIEYARELKIGIDHTEKSGLLYRIRKDSMSNVYNKKLIDDNALFYDELICHKLISVKELRKGYVLLLKSYTKIRDLNSARKYSMRLLRLRLSSKA